MTYTFFLRTAVFVFLMSFVLMSCTEADSSCRSLDPNKCSVLKNFVVFDSRHTVHFNHFCSEANNQYNSMWRSHVFFESQNPKALVLAKLLVGWLGNRELKRKTEGVGLSIEKMKMKGLNSWAGDTFALSLQLSDRQTGALANGELSKTYFYVDKGASPAEREYKVSEQGDVDWVEFPESKDNNRGNSHSEAIHVYKNNIDQIGNPQSLSLVVTNLNKGQSFMMAGPAVNDLEARLQLEKPAFKELGFFQTLNPSEPGGIWGWLKGSIHYKDCFYLRKKAKKDFDARFGK